MFDVLVVRLVLMASNDRGEDHVKSFSQPLGATRLTGSGPIYSTYQQQQQQQQQHPTQQRQNPAQQQQYPTQQPQYPTQQQQYPTQQPQYPTQQQQYPTQQPQYPTQQQPQFPPQQSHYQTQFAQDSNSSQPKVTHFSGPISPTHQQQQQPMCSLPLQQQQYLRQQQYQSQCPPSHPYSPQRVAYPVPRQEPSRWHLNEMDDMEKKNRVLLQKVEFLEKENLILSNRLQVIVDNLQPQSKWSMQHVPKLNQLIFQLREAKSPKADYDPILEKCDQISQVLNYIYSKASTPPTIVPDNYMVSPHRHDPTSETQPRYQEP